MWNPIAFYLDAIDIKASDDADGLIGPYSSPFAPLAVPAVIGGVITYLVAKWNPSWAFGAFVATMAISFFCWAGFTIYYYRAVVRCRRELGSSGRHAK